MTGTGLYPRMQQTWGEDPTGQRDGGRGSSSCFQLRQHPVRPRSIHLLSLILYLDGCGELTRICLALASQRPRVLSPVLNTITCVSQLHKRGESITASKATKEMQQSEHPHLTGTKQQIARTSLLYQVSIISTTCSFVQALLHAE